MAPDDPSPLDGSPLSGVKYWDVRAVRHRSPDGVSLYAIHEVYFDGNDKALAMTEDALSACALSVSELKKQIQHLLAKGTGQVRSGDLQYDYDREYVEDWVDACDAPVIDRESKEELTAPTQQ